MTLDDILHAAAGVLAVAMFGIGVLWGIHNNPTDTAIALFGIILVCGFVYMMRGELEEWQKEQMHKMGR